MIHLRHVRNVDSDVWGVLKIPLKPTPFSKTFCVILILPKLTFFFFLRHLYQVCRRGFFIFFTFTRFIFWGDAERGRGTETKLLILISGCCTHKRRQYNVHLPPPFFLFLPPSFFFHPSLPKVIKIEKKDVVFCLFFFLFSTK